MSSQSAVQVRTESVVIPTYTIAPPDKNPMYLEKRVYQGSSGVVYPHPIVERIFDDKMDHSYEAVFLENEYLEIMLLPELGGRVQMARDKTNDYHFVYYNRVIKPALVGLTGAWISGGIEFNWPQHHRPSTFEPVDSLIEKHDDGSVTVWFSEIERMFRTKGMVGFTLYPGRAYLELSVQLHNRTPLPQTFLWWANPAVHVNNDYQSIFPPDVYAVMDHGKRDVSSFPIATGEYYKVDYSPGTDISRYKNIPVPTSYMAYHSDFDFVGCYDHSQQAGMMHVANHHVVPGKKQWTWGNGDFGKTWDRQLTDEDGPYIELMCGAFTDNQPDFSWLQPGEEKRFTQVFMPYKGTGGAKNASKEAVVNLDISEAVATFSVYVTRPREVRVELLQSGDVIDTQVSTLDPKTSFTATVELDSPATDPTQFTLRVTDTALDQEIMTFTPLDGTQPDIPKPATAALTPEELPSNEALYLNGLHLEQYRHATYAPEPYYLEALRRDPLDSRCNTAMGRLLISRGKFADAETYLREAAEGITRRNPNPYDGEPYYQLGLACKLQGRLDDARDAFYKAVWNAAWQDNAYFELARIASTHGNWDEALTLAEESLSRNTRHHQAHHLRIAALRHQGHTDATRQAVEQALAQDRLNFGAYYERYLLDGDTQYRHLMRGYVHNYIELALDYIHAGLFSEADALLQEAPADDAMVGYYRGWCLALAGDETGANSAFQAAAMLSPDYCFPNRIECVLALRAASTVNPDDAFAPYYLGNFWYARRQYDDAIAAWERSRNLNPSYPTTHRNLGLAYMNKKGNSQKAMFAYTQAFSLDETDARVFFELDQLRKRLGIANEERLSLLEQHQELVQQRDDLTLETITLLNLTGKHERALSMLLSHRFHPWEGGEGKVAGQYELSRVECARLAMERGNGAEAIDHLISAQTYPENLGEGKLVGARENRILYYMGIAYAQMGQAEDAQTAFTAAATGDYAPSSAMYYNDQPPDMIFYQGLALHELERGAEAKAIFTQLVDYGQKHHDDEVKMDYFAVSLPDFLVFDVDLQQRHRIHCAYMMALGYTGLGQTEQANALYDDILSQEPFHIGAFLHRHTQTDERT